MSEVKRVLDILLGRRGRWRINARSWKFLRKYYVKEILPFGESRIVPITDLSLILYGNIQRDSYGGPFIFDSRGRIVGQIDIHIVPSTGLASLHYKGRLIAYQFQVRELT